MALFLRDLQRIEETAVALIKTCKITIPPVPVEIIATHVGLNVIAYNLGEGISGTLVVEKGKGFIGYNPSHVKGRQRFTIAHELGHFKLHRNASTEQLFVDKDFLVKYRSANNYSLQELKHEQEANAFAAALLMPKVFIHTELANKKYTNLPELELIETLARVFEVSVPAMTYRLNNLNILF
jgi:Zn-dependent peptidase ImmA (M78 family)